MTVLANLTDAYTIAAEPGDCEATAAQGVTDVGRLLLRCNDRPGLVAAVSTFLTRAGANIVSLDQHSTQRSGGMFMQRAIFHLPGLSVARDALEREFADEIANPFDMDFRLTEAATAKRVAIMASKDDHCLLDLLWRNRRGELGISVVAVISNHPELAHQAGLFGVPFVHIPATKETRARRKTSTRGVARQRRPSGAGPLHAGRHSEFSRCGRMPPDQHSPLVPAIVHRGRPPIGGPGNEASNSLGQLRTTSPNTSTRDPSSSRTWCG